MSNSDGRDKAGSGAGRVADFGGNRRDVIGAIIVTFVVGVLLVWFAVFAHPERVANMALTGIIAALLGWGAGVVATPYNPYEASALSDISKVGYAALTGYLVAKFDKLFDALFLKDNTVNAAVFPYAGFALAWFLLALFITYYTRAYRWSPQAKSGEQAKSGGPESKGAHLND